MDELLHINEVEISWISQNKKEQRKNFLVDCIFFNYPGDIYQLLFRKKLVRPCMVKKWNSPMGEEKSLGAA